MVNGCDILLIRDNRSHREMIPEALCEQRGKDSLHVFADGTEASDIFSGSPACLAEPPIPLPRLILLDFKRPKISGQEIRKPMNADRRTRHIPVVIFATSSEPQDRIERYRHGADSCVVKPMDADLFSRCVADIRLLLGHDEQDRLRRPLMPLGGFSRCREGASKVSGTLPGGGFRSREGTRRSEWCR